MDQLRAFVVLADELHFGRTAALLHLSQPALTKQIRRLEAEIGGPLFHRTTGRVALTPAGETLVARSRSLVSEARALEGLARQAVRGEAGHLRIGFGMATLSELLPRVVIAFRRAYPNVLLEMQDMGSRPQMDALVEGTLDLGFVRLPASHPRLESRLVLREEMMMVVPAARFKQKQVALHDLRQEPFVLIAAAVSSTFRHHAFSLCAEAGFTPHVIQEARETYTVLNLVRAGLGVSLVPSSARRMRVPGVRFVNTRLAAAHWQIGMVWRKDRRHEVERFTRIVATLSGGYSALPG